MPVSLESFPPWLQTILTGIGFVVALVIYLGGLLKKTPPVSRDVLVPNLNVMDSATIKEAAQTLRESMRQNEEREELVRGMFREQREQTELLRNIDSRLRALVLQGGG